MSSQLPFAGLLRSRPPALRVDVVRVWCLAAKGSATFDSARPIDHATPRQAARGNTRTTSRASRHATKVSAAPTISPEPGEQRLACQSHFAHGLFAAEIISRRELTL